METVLSAKDSRARRNFAILCSVIVGCIMSVSLAMTYSTFMASFADWPPLVQKGLTLFCCVAIDVTAMGLVYGIVYALSGALETILAYIGLAALVFVMGTNIVTHSMEVKHVPLSPWQQAYTEWIGGAVLIGVLVLVLAIKLSDPQTRRRRLERKLDMRLVEAEVEAQLDALDSDDFANFMETKRDLVLQAVAAKFLPARKTGFSTSSKQ